MFNFTKGLNKKQIDENKAANKSGNEEFTISMEAKEEIDNLPMVETLPKQSNPLLRSSQINFSENIDFNIALIKHRLPTENLICEKYSLGTMSKTGVYLVYIKHRANMGIVNEIKDRFKEIKAEAILDSSYIEKNIENSSISPFPQVETCTNVVVALAALIKGRILILVDGSPTALIAPTTFFDLMDTPDDYFSRWFVASSFFRFARYIMFIFAASLPGFYISLTSVNPNLLPSELLTLILASREGTAFPIYFEAFLMMGVVEAVRLMMVRMPTTIGSTIALFAGVVLVGAGLAANIISAAVTIIVTVTIISSFAIPNNDLRISVRIIQFFTMIMSTILGLFGYALAFFYIANNLVTLKSFGIPFMAPLAPIEGSGWLDIILKGNTVTMPQNETYKSYPSHEIINKKGDSHD